MFGVKLPFSFDTFGMDKKSSEFYNCTLLEDLKCTEFPNDHREHLIKKETVVETIYATSIDDECILFQFNISNTCYIFGLRYS